MKRQRFTIRQFCRYYQFATNIQNTIHALFTYHTGQNNEEKEALKVHKIENFFDSDFGICVISLLVLSKYKDFTTKNFLIGPLLGEVRFFRVVLGLRGMKKNFELGQKNFFFFNFGP